LLAWQRVLITRTLGRLQNTNQAVLCLDSTSLGEPSKTCYFCPTDLTHLRAATLKLFQKNSLNEKLLEAAKLGPTIFPILFAAIIGGFLRLVARWRAEKASTVEVKHPPAFSFVI